MSSGTLYFEFRVLVELLEVDLLALMFERLLDIAPPTLFAFHLTLALTALLRVSHYSVCR
jgi:hypothetical protein